MDHFSITADPSELTNAETKLGWLADQLGGGGEGGKLARSHGNLEGWSGEAASAVIAEMGRIATGMTSVSPKLTTAHDAVKAFRILLQNAMQDDLVKLNQRWSEADDAYDTAVRTAGTVYDGATKPGSSGAPVSDEDRRHASDAEAKATTAADSSRTASRKSINADFDSLKTSLQQSARTCGDALAAAAPFTFSHDQWVGLKGGGPIPSDLWREMREAALGKDSLVAFVDEQGGEEAEKPEWLETAEKAVKPLEATFWSMDTTAFALFNSTAGGGVKDLFTNGKLWDLYQEDGLSSAVGWERGLTTAESAGVGIGDATKLLDGRAFGALFVDGSRAGELVGKVGVLGPISVGLGVYSTADDLAQGHYGAAAHDGVETALTAGALLAPPPADLVCGGAVLAMAAYDNIPVVHDVVDAVGSGIKNAASSTWHAISSWF